MYGARHALFELEEKFAKQWGKEAARLISNAVLAKKEVKEAEALAESIIECARIKADHILEDARELVAGAGVEPAISRL